MHIALVSQEYPPDSAHGGIGTQTAAKARALAARGHLITVISSSADTQMSDDCGGSIRVLRLGGGVGQLVAATEEARWVLRSTEVAEALSDIQRANPIDVIDFPDYGGEGFVWLLNRRRGVGPAVVVHLHGPLGLLTEKLGWPAQNSTLYEVGTMMERTCITLADAVISSSHTSLEFTARCYGIDTRLSQVVHTGVDIDVFRPSVRPVEAAPTVIFVGRLSASKGIFRLLEAMEAIAPTVPDLRLVLVGRTDEACAMELRRRIAQMAFPVELRGVLSHESLPAALADADVFAAPSEFEGGPGLVYLEAMSVGLAVVGPAGGGVAEVIDPGRTGLLVPPDDTKALAAAVRDLLCNPERRRALGTAARREIELRFSTEQGIDQIQAVYKATCARVQP